MPYSDAVQESPFPAELARFDPERAECLWCSNDHREDLNGTRARTCFVLARAAWIRAKANARG